MLQAIVYSRVLDPVIASRTSYSDQGFIDAIVIRILNDIHLMPIVYLSQGSSCYSYGAAIVGEWAVLIHQTIREGKTVMLQAIKLFFPPVIASGNFIQVRAS